ncbi:MAG TPA: hypothetical protein VIC85_02210 [Ktedonobacterales bacterium]
MRGRLTWWWAEVIEALNRRVAAWQWLSPTTRAWVGWGLALVLAVTVGGGVGFGLLALGGGHEPAPVNLAPVGRPALAQLDADWYQASHYGTMSQAAPGAAFAAVAAAERMSFGPGQPLTGQGAPGGSRAESSSINGTWEPIGPAPKLSGGRQTSGAVTAVAVDPAHTNTVWIGTANGGVWRSLDGGHRWEPRFAHAPVQAIGSLAIDPAHPNTIYVGTGTAPRTPNGSPGMGIFKSADAGASWTQLGFKQLAGLSVTRIAVDPFVGGVVLAAAAPPESPTLPGPSALVGPGGIWRSADGGHTWVEVLGDAPSTVPGIQPPDAGTDVAFAPALAGVVYAGVGNLGYASQRAFPSAAGLYRSGDDGRTWSRITRGVPSGNAVSRVSVGVARDGGWVYAVLAACGRPCGQAGTTGDLLGGAIYVSSDRGLTWSGRGVPPDSGMSDDQHEHGWWYASVVGVDPTSRDTLYVGGRDLWRTTDGGRSWRDLTLAGVGTEQYALAFDGASGDFYEGNDAGIWRGGHSGDLTDLNGGGLNIATVASASVAVADGMTTIFAAVPDWGVFQHAAATCVACDANTTWTATGLASGEVDGIVVDVANPNVLYASGAYGTVLCSMDGGAHWSSACGAGIGDRGRLGANYVAPLVMSPNNHHELLVGTRRVYRTTDGGRSWTAISPVLDGQTPLSALAMARDNDVVIYAGDDQGRIFETRDGGHAWSANLAPASAPAQMVTALATVPGAPGIVYAAYAGFAGRAGGHLYKSTDSGGDWKDVSAGLPDAPCESVVVLPSNPRFVVAGTDVGVFYSPDAGSHWYVLGNGLPRMPIDQLVLAPNGSALYAATHGRGMWALTGHLLATPESLAVTTTAGVGARVTLTLRNTGGSVLAWGLGAPLPAWLTLGATSGVLAPQTQTVVTLTVTNAQPGTYATSLVLETSRSDNAMVKVPVTVTVW